MKLLKLLFSLSLMALAGLTLRAAEAPAEGENLAVRSLKKIVERQKEIFATAEKKGGKVDEESLRVQVQSLIHEYERLLRDNPKFAAGHVAYADLLNKVGMRKEWIAMLLKANQLDGEIPYVKNQIGNYLAEDGKPLEAAQYYLSAIKLEPKEPLYHYQIAALMVEARDDFLRSGEWTRAAIDEAVSNGFRQASQLAPDRFEFAYRYAESFYDVAKPDWDAALKLWAALEEKAPTPIERQTMRLHAANVLIKQGKFDHARSLIATVDETALQGQKQKLVAQLPETAKK
jgi:tetratricopeptide (TPR) repeat protein